MNHELPKASIWPFVLGLGITLLLFGVVSSLSFSVAGLITLAAAIIGWIKELADE